MQHMAVMIELGKELRAELADWVRINEHVGEVQICELGTSTPEEAYAMLMPIMGQMVSAVGATAMGQPYELVNAWEALRTLGFVALMAYIGRPRPEGEMPAPWFVEGIEPEE